jgi:hypothetical protein
MMRLLLATATAWLFLWSAATAETGLERFEREIKPQIDLKSFTYKGAETLGNTGFVLKEVVAVMPATPATGDKESTVTIDKVTVEALDFDRMKALKDDDIPRFAKIQLEGMNGNDEIAGLLDPYGIPRVPMDVLIDYRLDGAAKVFTLNALEISLRGQGKLGLALVIDGVSDKSSEVGGARDDGRLRSASLTVDDKGLIAKLLPAIAKEQGETAEAFVALALVSIAAFCDGQGVPTVKALDAVASFVGDWKEPKGALVIGLKPTKRAAIADLDKVMEPDALVDIFGLSASYPGTRDGAAKAGPAGK